MTDRIINALAAAGVKRWIINEKKEESAELFFVKHMLDTRRIKDTHKYSVSVFRTVEHNGKILTGSTDAVLISSMSDREIADALKSAYYAAQFALNPDYAPASPVRSETVGKTGELAEAPLQESAGKMAAAAFGADRHSRSFINSLEIFCHRMFNRILTSEGTDVSYTDAVCKGEYVVQCKEPEDVEKFTQFEYDRVDTGALARRIGDDLKYVSDRADAQNILKSGTYDVILSGENLAQVLSYYAEKSSAEMIFPGYSQWKVGEGIQGSVKGEKVNLSLEPNVPFSNDGIPMRSLKIVEDGKLSAVHGSTRFCRYLGVEPTGNYSKAVCSNEGTVTFDQMKQTPCLWPVVFSDFQMDSFSGHFGGEIRLAYLIKDGEAVPVSGGSINGSLIEAQQDMCFSKERYSFAQYEGPYAAKFRGIAVAGTAE